MSTIIEPPDNPADQQSGRLLHFPAELSPPPALTAREIARLIVADYRQRHAQKGNGQAKPENRSTGLETPANGIVGSGQTLMRELTPPIQSDRERGEGDSTNARMHRILRRP